MVRVVLWAEIAEEIRAAIRSGDLPAGAALPSVVRDAAARGVSHGTVQQARTVLVTEGWLRTVPGAGVFVADRQPVDASDLEGMVRDALAGIAGLGARVDRIERLVIAQTDDVFPASGQ